jgi:hypothetical protein
MKLQHGTISEGLNPTPGKQNVQKYKKAKISKLSVSTNRNLNTKIRTVPSKELNHKHRVPEH